MTFLERYKTQIQTIAVQLEEYEAKPNKAKSLRLRNSINNIKNLSTATKKELMENDKAGYKTAE